MIPPGVDFARWSAYGARPRAGESDGGPVRILFVGGDLARKGGHVLLGCGRARSRAGGVDVELDMVTARRRSPTRTASRRTTV